MAKINKKEAQKMLASIKNKPELIARLNQLMGSLLTGNCEPADTIDADLKYTKGPKENHRRRLSFFDRQEITNSNGAKRITIATRAPDDGDGAAIVLNGKGKACIGLVMNGENGQSSLQLTDDHNVIRLQIGLGRDGVPLIIFRDKNGRESFCLTDEHVRFGRAKEEQIEFQRAKSKVTLTVRGKKGAGMAAIGVVEGQPCVALIDNKNIHHVGMTADPKSTNTNIGILRKGKYIWTAIPQATKKAGKRLPPSR